MSSVLTEATIYNLHDLTESKFGKLPSDQVRFIRVNDALVDTGATTICLPKRYIEQLGLTKQFEKRTKAAGGMTTMNVYDAVRIEIRGQFATADPIEIPDECPILIGQIPLEMMDWVVDLQARRLVSNPAHGGEHIPEVL